MSSITDALRDARIRAGLSQRCVAVALGVSPAYLSDMEHGRRDFALERVGLLPEVMRVAVAAAFIVNREADIARVRILSTIPRGIKGAAE